MSSVPVSKPEWVDIDTPPETNADGSADIITKNITPMVPAKKQSRGNNSVSGPTFGLFGVTKEFPDQDVLLAQCVARPT